MKQKLNSYSNLTQRIIAALIAVPLLIFGIYYSEFSFFGIFLLICILTQLEFYKLLKLNENSPLLYYGTFCGAALFSLSFLVETHRIADVCYYIISPLLTAIFFIKLYKKDDFKPFMNIAYTFLGIIYVALPFALIVVLAHFNGTYSWQIILGSLFLLWASDTGAYFAGTNFGKTKLFERVSPKKSWEGSIGGFISAMIVAFFLAKYFNDIAPWQWYIIGAIIVIAGTLGDLVESLFKRSIQIKDSGSIIPGHGGFLDRFDGLLLSVPFIIAFLKLF
jgi:phosphatidate cytidylyltransferase